MSEIVSVILSIETSVPTASVALWVDDDVIYQKNFTSDRNHNSMIFEPLGEALAMLDDRKLTHVIVGTGPGSYSGARTGIATGQGVAITHACPAVGIGSLAATPPALKSSKAVAVGDARRGLYFISEINTQGEAQEAQLMPADEFEAKLSELCADGDTHLFTFDDPEGAWLNDVQLPCEIERAVPNAEGLIQVWLGLPERRRDELVQLPLMPAYLRPPFTSKAKSGHPLLRSS